MQIKVWKALKAAECPVSECVQFPVLSVVFDLKRVVFYSPYQRFNPFIDPVISIPLRRGSGPEQALSPRAEACALALPARCSLLSNRPHKLHRFIFINQSLASKTLLASILLPTFHLYTIKSVLNLFVF